MNYYRSRTSRSLAGTGMCYESSRRTVRIKSKCSPSESCIDSISDTRRAYVFTSKAEDKVLRFSQFYILRRSQKLIVNIGTEDHNRLRGNKYLDTFLLLFNPLWDFVNHKWQKRKKNTFQIFLNLQPIKFCFKSITWLLFHKYVSRASVIWPKILVSKGSKRM